MIDVHELEAMDLADLMHLRDACNVRILLMRRTEGLRLPELLRLFEEVKETLIDQNKKWYSLERWEWRDGGIRFWLNPTNQELYRPGWYTIDELIAWTHDVGPVMMEEAAVEDDEEVYA